MSEENKIHVWRIVHPRYLDTADAGAGAEQFGGRFNSKGRKVVYTAGSLALAVLEMLVQVNTRARLAGYWCVSASFEEHYIEHPRELPEGWDARPYTNVSQQVGDRWLDQRQALILRVPSVVIPQAYNYLINPAHPDFDKISLGKPFLAPIDPRLSDANQ